MKRLPDEVLLDKKTKKGDFDLRDDEPGYKDFVLQPKVPALPGDGVFTIRLELDDGTVSEGWFIGHDLEASAAPEIKSPVPTATLAERGSLTSQREENGCQVARWYVITRFIQHSWWPGLMYARATSSSTFPPSPGALSAQSRR